MSKVTNRAAAALAAALIAACVALVALPAFAYAQDGAADTARAENSWRYSAGELLDAADLVAASGGESQLAASTFDIAYAWTRSDNGFLNESGGVIPNAVRKGIDVSEHNHAINWQAVKSSGVDFAIIRCGYGSDYANQDDKTWLYNVAECERLGIPYGVYLYSYAEDDEMAKSEAEHVLRLLKGHHPSYPVYLDLEESSMADADNAEQLASIATIFCDAVSDAGYTPGVYANLTWWNNYLTDPVFEKWDRWVAQYNDSCWYEGEYNVWQAASDGTVDGVEGNVDVNFEVAAGDVSLFDWYTSSTGVYQYVNYHGIMGNYSGTNLFGPYDDITRGQVATILWRMAGEPVATAADFEDVSADAYYAQAVRWARSVGVVDGYQDADGEYRLFNPEKPVTREELAKMLERYAALVLGWDTQTDCALMDAKVDAGAVSPWAREVMGWAVDEGLISGIREDGVDYLTPQATAWRASMASMVYSLCK